MANNWYGTGQYPLEWPDGWPREGCADHSGFNRERTFSRARDALFSELYLLEASAPVISTNLELRNDGWPRASEKTPEDRGVAVYFGYHDTASVMACDRFKRIACNVWAIHLSVKAMRSLARYGASNILDRAFRGFAQIGHDPTAKTEGIVVARDWWDVLGCRPTDDPYTIRKAYRLKAKRYHPDRGGDEEAFKEINAAWQTAKIQRGFK